MDTRKDPDPVSAKKYLFKSWQIHCPQAGKKKRENFGNKKQQNIGNI